MRFDSQGKLPGDFGAAIANWAEALTLNPGQYIWRRRIQQYGPLLDKPYPFYDWIPLARKEIGDRGDRPWPLNVEPSGAELADPGEETVRVRNPNSEVHPDPLDRLPLDNDSLVEMQIVAVPGTNGRPSAFRRARRGTPSPRH